MLMVFCRYVFMATIAALVLRSQTAAAVKATRRSRLQYRPAV